MRWAVPWLILLVVGLAPLAAADDTDYDVGPVHVHVDWNETEHCVADLPDLPCPVGYDDNGTPTDPGDDTVYNYYALDSVDVDVDQIGPVQGSTFHYDPDEQYIGHHVIDTVDSVLGPLERGLPDPVGRYTDYHEDDNASQLDVCPPIPTVPFVPPCVYVPVLVPNTDRNGTHLPPGVNPDGDSTDNYVHEVVDTLHLCWIYYLGMEESPLCNFIPGLDEAEQAYRDLTPNIVHGVAVNETTVRVMDPSSGAAQDPSRAFAAVPSDSSESAPDERRVPRDGLDQTGSFNGLRPSAKPPSSAGPGNPPELSASSHAALVLPAPSGHPWLLPAAAALLAPLAWALYHRITRTRALEHEARRRMLTLVRDRPGILIADAARALGITYHPASHHARILQRYGHLDLVQVGRNIAIYPAGTVPLRHRGPMVNLRRGPQAEALRVLQVRPGLTPSDLAAQLGCARSTAHANLRRLLRQELVCKDGGGYHITGHGVEALDVAERWEPRAAVMEPASP